MSFSSIQVSIVPTATGWLQWVAVRELEGGKWRPLPILPRGQLGQSYEREEKGSTETVEEKEKEKFG